MSEVDGTTGTRRWRLRRGDIRAMLWAIACCWLAVGGNYLLIALRLGATWLVLFDLFAVPAIVSLAFWVIGRRWNR